MNQCPMLEIAVYSLQLIRREASLCMGFDQLGATTIAEAAERRGCLSRWVPIQKLLGRDSPRHERASLGLLEQATHGS